MTEHRAHRLRPRYQELLVRHKGWVWLITALLVLLLFFQTVVSALTAVLLIVIGSFSTIWRRVIRLNVGFELITPIFVIFAFAYNPIIALLAAAFMTIASAALSNTIGPTTFGRIGCYGLLTVFTFMLLGADVLLAGKILIVFYQAMLVFLYGFTYGFRFFSSAIPVTVNIVTNVIFLRAFAPGLLAAL